MTGLSAAAPAAYRVSPVVGTGLESPVDAVTIPGTTRIAVVEQPGRVRIVEKGTLLSDVFLDIRSRVRWGGEMGLLSIAFHPKFADAKSAHKGRYFVDYTSPSGGLKTVVAEYREGKPEEIVLLEFAQPYTNHNGGQLAFGPDGMLYIGVGDGGGAGDPQKNGQKKDTWLGKILRIDVDGKRPYAIPPGNPFAKGGGRPEIFALGMRNPWRFSFDPGTGRLFVGDVGQWKREEIDIVVQGGNYGWRGMEGALCFEPSTNCQRPEYLPPIHDYDRDDGQSITGGLVYRGQKIPPLVGKYVFGDYESEKIWALREEGKEWKRELLLDAGFPISSFGSDAEEEVLVVAHRSGTRGGLFRLVGP